MVALAQQKLSALKTSDNKSVINNNERLNLPFLTRIFISLYYPSSISNDENTGFLEKENRFSPHYKLTRKKDLLKCLISFLV